MVATITITITRRTVPTVCQATRQCRAGSTWIPTGAARPPHPRLLGDAVIDRSCDWTTAYPGECRI